MMSVNSPPELTLPSLNSLVILASVLATLIAKGKTTDEINVIGNFLATLGTALTVLGSETPERLDRQPPDDSTFNNLQCQINRLELEIKQLKQKLSPK